MVTFDSGEDETSILRGITVQNGGTGIYCYYSDPLITNCVVRYIDTYAIEGSIASPSIVECIITVEITAADNTLRPLLYRFQRRGQCG